jgi:hypothetical protein
MQQRQAISLILIRITIMSEKLPKQHGAAVSHSKRERDKSSNLYLFYGDNGVVMFQVTRVSFAKN